MGSLKALQEWCRIQCESYNDVDVRDMTTSFRDGLAFCAIIHRHRPDLIDFDSLSKENVYENNRLAFEVAESELGIPALLDAEDMVSMKVPDRLSIITYVSQYYNFFTNKSHANPPCMKRPSGTGQIEPALKRLVAPLEDRVVEPETGAAGAPKRSTLSSTCAACGKHVHLVQRFLVDGKLYHRNCFRCKECSSTLLPGSYKPGSDAGSLVCTHHFARSSSTNQNGRPDLSKQPGMPARIRPKRPETPPKGRSLDRPAPTENAASPQATALPDPATKSDSMERETEKEKSVAEKVAEKGGETSDSVKEETAPPKSSTPPNPFDETDEEEEEEEKRGQDENAQKPAPSTLNGAPPHAPLGRGVPESKPVPAPRRPAEVTPPPRPAPRNIHLVVTSPAVNGDPNDRRRSAPVPRERSHSPGSSSQSSDTPKPKDPPWLALVQSDTKKKPAPPPPPPPGLGASQRTGPVPSLKGEGSRPCTPPQSSNPFDDDEDEEELAEEPADSSAPPSALANHPWYSITQAAAAAEASGTDTPPRRTSPAPSASPGSARKRRPAPRPPRPSTTAPSLSQPSSASPSPALSTESLCSSSSDHGQPTSQPPAPTSSSSPSSASSSAGPQEPTGTHPFTKSVSEPSISGPSPPPSDSQQQQQQRRSPSPSAMPVLAPPTNTSSAPATPQTSRSAGLKAPRPPPPRPPAASMGSLSAGASPADTPTHSKRTCKENPFNRKASPSHPSPTSRPPKGPRPARPPAPGHGFPLIKRKVQSDQYIPVEDIHGEMGELERQLDELEQRGVELEKRLRDCGNDEEEEHLLVDWFTLIHEKHQLVRREAELVYTAKQQNLEERQADVEYELRCLLNKPEKEWTDEDKNREKELMAELVTIIEQRNQIINNMDQDRQREEEEDKLLAAMLKRKDFHKEGDEPKKKGAKFKPMKVLKRLSHKSEGPKGGSPHKDKS
ncbi:MICAL-like protein 1 isoform X1 [Alosa pseudoharengus]|uniref:MICAL-like protein 1 isoform X1 n=2 Tax=Alosa pseudoharengus TaxID=34774 RepID=UPI003F8C3565